MKAIGALVTAFVTLASAQPGINGDDDFSTRDNENLSERFRNYLKYRRPRSDCRRRVGRGRATRWITVPNCLDNKGAEVNLYGDDQTNFDDDYTISV